MKCIFRDQFFVHAFEKREQGGSKLWGDKHIWSIWHVKRGPIWPRAAGIFHMNGGRDLKAHIF